MSEHREPSIAVGKEQSVFPFGNTATVSQQADKIPGGIFFAGDYDPQRVAALRRAIALGNELSGTHPEVVDAYRDTNLTYSQIAEQVIPDISVAFPEVASKAIGVAVRSLMTEDEQAEITASRRSENLKHQMQELGVEGFKKHQQDASRRKYALHGAGVEAMLRGRGRISWSEDEKRLVFELCEKSEFQHQKGNKLVRGSPNYGNIAFAVNELFHNGQEIRHGSSVGSLVRDVRRNKNKI
jgi:hypothetical protein